VGGGVLRGKGIRIREGRWGIKASWKKEMCKYARGVGFWKG